MPTKNIFERFRKPKKAAPAGAASLTDAELGAGTATPQAAAAAAGADDSRFTLTLTNRDWQSAMKESTAPLARTASEINDAELLYRMGVAYSNGTGVTRDLNEAFRCFVKGAGLMSVKCAYRLAVAYEQGLGVDRDMAKALSWYQNAADGGDADAQFSLAVACLTGMAGPKNVARAVDLFHKAAMNGHIKAQFNLGSLYCSGEGVGRDVAAAAMWYERAAAQGHARAQNNLGWLFNKGLGIAKNAPQAVVWFARSAAQGHEPAVRNLAEALGQVNSISVEAGTQIRNRPESGATVLRVAAAGEKAYLISSFGTWHEVYFQSGHTLGFIDTAASEKAPVTAEPEKRIEMRLGLLRDRRLLPPQETDHRISNEFRAIKRVLLGNLPGRTEKPLEAGNIIMVSSALPSEGKTVCTLNLALALAMEHDYSVVLIDGDVINPTISRSLNVEEEPGLLDVLRTPDGDLSEVEIGTGVPGLSVVPAGRRDQDAPELLSSNRMAKLVARMKAQPNRIFLFDSTPVLLTNESRSLSEMAGQIAFVVRAGVTPRAAVKAALSFLPVDTYKGLILNHKSGSDHGEAYYYYGYDYYKPAPERDTTRESKQSEA